ncbi:MAG: cytidylate kinase-like family protein [Eubacterium aggregans]|jgi:cytidylate kinase|uniref:Cytidylate kinase n=1 Tax=Eubacterium aggregans TaxID=81409 RepID=A0A1H3ZN52_9FIRM|nr:cytidylate kinase-like family protein [Eubacterium aggregans]MEA5074341.1 cytidylate kinase-like family protein [Eubacterium aggregans]SEA25088.1 cytidylate kinase [Eubacterium aggregans]
MRAKRQIITISRQFGSGGHNIAKRLAKRLEIPFYDEEIIVEAAKESGIDPEMVKALEETPTNSLLYSLSSSAIFGGGSFSPVVDLPMTDKVFLAQSEVIRQYAEAGSCVIVGRCGNFVLRDDPDAVDVFIHRDLEERINQVAKLYDLTQKKAAESVKKVDKQRSGYANYYSDRNWGQADNYDLALNSGLLGEDGCIEVIITFLNRMALRKKARG